MVTGHSCQRPKYTQLEGGEGQGHLLQHPELVWGFLPVIFGMAGLVPREVRVVTEQGLATGPARSGWGRAVVVRRDISLLSST